MSSFLPRVSAEIESPIASLYVPSYGAKTGAYRRRADCVAIVVHTTGAGPVKRWRAMAPAERDAVRLARVAAETYSSGRCGSAGPHYCIDQAGACIQTAQERFAAHHTGSAGGLRYVTDGWAGGWLGRRRYRWWHERWKLDASPAALADGLLWGAAGGRPSCNAHTIGVEVVPPVDDLRGPWSEMAWDTLSRLILDLAVRNKVPVAETHILTHSDAHPLARTTLLGKPWDTVPGQFSWERLCVELRRLGVVGFSTSARPPS